MNHDRTPEDEALEEIYMHNTLPVAPERERLIVRLKKPKLMDYEEMKGLKEVPTETETNKESKDAVDKMWDAQEVREHHYNQATKKWGKWTTSKLGEKILN